MSFDKDSMKVMTNALIVAMEESVKHLDGLPTSVTDRLSLATKELEELGETMDFGHLEAAQSLLLEATQKMEEFRRDSTGG